MLGPRTRSQVAAPPGSRIYQSNSREASENGCAQLQNFIKTQDGQGLSVLVHGKKVDLIDLRACVQNQYQRQAIDFTDKLCAIIALEISLRPVCTELGLAAPSKGALLDAFLTNREYKPAARKFFNLSTGDVSLGEPREDRKRGGFLSLNTIRVVLYLMSRTYSTNFRLGLCQPRGDGLNFDITVFDPLADEATRKISRTRTVWLYKNGLTRDNGLGWEAIAPDDSRPSSLDSVTESQQITGPTPQSFQTRPEISHKRQRSFTDEPQPSKKARISPAEENDSEPVSRFTRSHQNNWVDSHPPRPKVVGRSIIKQKQALQGSSGRLEAVSSSPDLFSDADEETLKSFVTGADINYIRRSPRAQMQPPWEYMADITIEELLLWFPNHVLNWPGLALLVESKGWDQAHVAKFLFNNLVAKMKEEDQFTVKLNTVGSKLSRAIKKLPGYDQYSFTTRANYESLVADSLSMYLLQPPDGWDTDPAELWEFFIPPEQKEIRVPSEVRGRPFSQRLYNAYCDRHGIARPYADVPGPMPLRPGEPHPLLDSPDLDTEYPIGLGIRYVRENAQEWHAGGTNLSLTIDARIPEDYDRRDLVRDFPHLLFGDTFLYVHAELSHRDIVQIWRDENEAYLRHQWRADTDSDLVKKAEAAVRKRKQMAIENFARKEDGIVARKAKANNLTVERVHQAFNRYKGECGHKGREVRRRMSRSELDKIQRDRESRRVQRRRIENISRSPTMSSDSSKTIGRSSNRAARAFSTQKDDLLASDILYSGPPVRNHAPIANMSGPDPYPGINPIHQDYWYPNPEFLSNDPSALPLNGYEGTVAASATDGVEPWNAPMGFDFNSDFDMNKLFNNPSFASFSRNFRDSNPELTAIPNTSSAPNPKQTAQTAGPIDPLLLDSAQYERAPLETRAANSQSELPKYYYNPQQLSQHQAQKSQQAFDRRTSSIPHQDQRRSTGHSSGFERFVAEITANHTSGGSFQAGLGEGFTEQEAFDAFTTVNGTIPDTEERWLQKRKSSERSQLFEGAWNAFVAMPSAAPLNMDGELDEELGEIE